MVNIRLGRSEQAESRIAQAIRLSPRDPEIATWSFFVGYAAYHLDDLDRAILIMQQSLDISPRFALIYFILAGALAAKGRDTEAQSAVERGLALRPKFTVSAFAKVSQGTNATFLAQRARIYDDMRKAGVPGG